MRKYPYSEDGDVRIFSPEVLDSELEWHVDFEDRIITVIKSGGWSFQYDNDLPRKLIDGEVFNIKKFTWHRIISGQKELVIRVCKIE